MTVAHAAVLAYRETRDTVVREYPLRLAVTAGVAWIISGFSSAYVAAAWWGAMALLLGIEALAFIQVFRRERESMSTAHKALFAVISFACSCVYTIPVWIFLKAGTPVAYFAAAAFLSGTLIHTTVHNANTHLIYASAATPMAATLIGAGVLLSSEGGFILPAATVAIFLSAMVTAYLGRLKGVRLINEAMSEALRERETARQASAAKSAFLAKMSHELRTPLNGMLGMAQALRENNPDGARAEEVDTIIRSGDALLRILNEILDYSKIDGGSIKVVSREEDLLRVIEDAVGPYRTAAREKGVALTLNLSAAEDRRLRLDGERLRQGLSEIVANAVKFTDSGAVLVKASTKKAGDGMADLEITVSDTGIGMTEEECARVFEPFEQADNSPTRRFGGAGLGLTVARGLIKALGGEISAHSKKGAGATITIRLTAEVAPELAEPAFETPGIQIPAAPAKAPAAFLGGGGLDGARILLVEDNLVNRQVVRALLRPLNVEVIEAENGEEALTRLKENRFDMVLMDLHMPVMDGLTATRAIRGSCAEWAAIPVVALTAASSAEDRAASLDAGMNDFLGKPVKGAVLAEVIRRFATASLPAPSAAVG
ncbi:MAG: response regulator [Parvularculaceae bacterium]